MSCASISSLFAPLLRSFSAEDADDHSDSASIVESAILETPIPLYLNDKPPQSHIQWLQSHGIMCTTPQNVEKNNSFPSSLSLGSRCDCSSLSSGSYDHNEWEDYYFEDRYSSIRRIHHPVKNVCLKRVATTKL
mmetsp:Transcript_18455/g.27887  ORF Transcript_18455/g.27887 Transcript_18455/m.27887 type:complete len:134 (+) Transcript_18455:81-482(+)